jgi:hypothetical protein
MTVRSGMVASVLVAAMPPVGCLSYRHDHREDEDGAPGADERDGDQCVDGHSEPYSSRRYCAAAGAQRVVISRCPPSSFTDDRERLGVIARISPRVAIRWNHGREPDGVLGGDRPPAVTRSPAVEGMAAPDLRARTPCATS